MNPPNPRRARHSHPINGLSLIPQHILNSNTPSPRLSRPAIDPYKAFTAQDLDGFVDSITHRIRNALLGTTPTTSSSIHKPKSRTSDVFGKLQSVDASQETCQSASLPSSSNPQSQLSRVSTPHFDRHHHEDRDLSEDNHFQEPPRETTLHDDLNTKEGPLVLPSHASRTFDSDQANPSSSAIQPHQILRDPLQDKEDVELDSEIGVQDSDSSSDQSDQQVVQDSDQDLRSKYSDPDTDHHHHPVHQSSPSDDDIISIDQPFPNNQSPAMSASSRQSHQTSSDSEPDQDSQLEDLVDHGSNSSDHSSKFDSDSSSILIEPSRSDSACPESHESDEQDDQTDDEEEDGDEVDDQGLHTLDLTTDSEAEEQLEIGLDDGQSDETDQENQESLADSQVEDQKKLELINGPLLSQSHNTSDELVALQQHPSPKANQVDFQQSRPSILQQVDVIQSLDLSTDRPSNVLDQSQFHDIPTSPKPLQMSDIQQSRLSPIVIGSCDQVAPETLGIKENQTSQELDGLPFSDCETHLSSTQIPPVNVFIHSVLPNSVHPYDSTQANEPIDSAQLQSSSEETRSKKLSSLEPNNAIISEDELKRCDLTLRLPVGTPSPFDSLEARSELEKKIAPEEQAEEQAEDNHDLFEGDEDLRLHRLGVERQALLNANQSEGPSSGSIPIQDSLQDAVEDLFSTIEKKVEDFLPPDCQPSSVMKEEWIQNDSCQGNSILANSTSQSMVVHRAISLTGETTAHHTTVQDSSVENTSVGLTEKVQYGVPNVHQDDTVQSSSRVLWGDLSSELEATPVTQDMRMDQVQFFPLKQSDSEISNPTSWTPAFSTTTLSDNHNQVNLPLFIQSSTVCFTLPPRPSFRQVVNLDEDDPVLVVEAQKHPREDSKVPSSSPRDKDDYDMLASSITDGDSDIAPPDTKEGLGNVGCDMSGPDSEGEEGSLSLIHQARGGTAPGREDHRNGLNHIDANTLATDPSSQFTLLSPKRSFDYPSNSIAFNDSSSESDDLLAQFVYCDANQVDVNLLDLPVSTSPVLPGIPVPAVTFAASPPMEMDDLNRFGDQLSSTDLIVGRLDTTELNSVIEPQTPLTSTTQGPRTSSESSERLLSRGSASLVTYSAPSSVVSSDGDSVPASVAPPPPLPNASMGAPTEAIGLSNQMIRRSSIDSSTHAEPPSPSTSTRQRSAPITQEQVNAPGLPHVEATEVPPSAISGLPDPLRSPPPMNASLISNCPNPISASLSQASSLVAHPPSPSFSTALAGSCAFQGVSNRDHSPPPNRLSLPDPRATPLPVSIPAIKLEDIPDNCLSIERNVSADSSAASQPATSPGFKLSPIPSPPVNNPDSSFDENLQAVGQINHPDIIPSSVAHEAASQLDQQDDHSVSPSNQKRFETVQEVHGSLESPTATSKAQPLQARSPGGTGDHEAPGMIGELESPTGQFLNTGDNSPNHNLSGNETVPASPADQQDLTINEASKPSQDTNPDPNSEPVVDPSETGSSDLKPTRNKRKRKSKVKDPTFTVRSAEIEAEERKELDRESQLREILRKRRTSKPGPSQPIPEQKNTKKKSNPKAPLVETKTKANHATTKRSRPSTKADLNSEYEIESTLPSDTPEIEPKETPVRNKLPRAAKRVPNASQSNLVPPGQSRSPSNATTRSGSPYPFPSSPTNLNACEESSHTLSPFERDDRTLLVSTRRSSRQSQLMSSPVVSNNGVSVIVPLIKHEDAVPKLRLHQHNLKGPLFLSQTDRPHLDPSLQSNSDVTDSKVVTGAGGRTTRRKQSDGATEGRQQLPPSLPPVTRSHCHFIRLKFQDDQHSTTPKIFSVGENSERKYDTFLVPQCATGNEEIKSKMNAFKIFEEDNLTGEEQSRGVRVGHDGKKHGDERLDESSSCILSLKEEHYNFMVDEETMNCLIEIFGLSLIQDGQVEVLLPKHYFKRFDDPVEGGLLETPDQHELQSKEKRKKDDDEIREEKISKSATIVKEEKLERNSTVTTKDEMNHKKEDITIDNNNNVPNQSDPLDHSNRLKRRAQSPFRSPESRSGISSIDPSSVLHIPIIKSNKRKKSH